MRRIRGACPFCCFLFIQFPDTFRTNILALVWADLIRVPAEDTNALVFGKNDSIRLCVNLKRVFLTNIQCPSQLDWNHNSPEFVNSADDAGGFQLSTPPVFSFSLTLYRMRLELSIPQHNPCVAPIHMKKSVIHKGGFAMMAWIWTGFILIAVVFGTLSGNASALSNSAIEGASAAVRFCISTGGIICLWSGVMELMRQSGLATKLAGLLSPVLKFLFPRASRDEKTKECLAENMSANLLGLGNAATPAGIEAAQGILRLGGDGRELSRLVVLNTASIQLIPTTIAAVRAAAGAEHAFDILPAVWISSVVSVFVGLLAEFFLAGKRE